MSKTGSSKFEKSFTQQEAISEAAIARAVEIMRGGRLHRYNVADDELSEAALLERDFAAYQGSSYCLACTSGGYAIHVALRSAGLKPGEKVLANAYTLAPVPGAIHNAGGVPVFVEIDRNYHIDLADLDAKAAASGARFLMLSHMRGHIADMAGIVEICERHGITLIEDCAHTMGAAWAGRPSGTFGRAACFSTQTYKHINSGEGGLLVTDDEDIAAQAILLSGSYMLYEQHGAAPPNEVFERHRATTPNWSMRMSALAAAVAHPQIEELPERRRTWNERYERIANALTPSDVIDVPNRDPKEGFAASSIQFTARGLTSAQIIKAIEVCAAHGVYVKWFGNDRAIGFTSRFDHWRYAEEQSLGKTSAILHGLCDMRIPLSMSLDECDLIAEILRGAFEAS